MRPVVGRVPQGESRTDPNRAFKDTSREVPCVVQRLYSHGGTKRAQLMKNGGYLGLQCESSVPVSAYPHLLSEKQLPTGAQVPQVRKMDGKESSKVCPPTARRPSDYS